MPKHMLARAATYSTDERETKEASDTFGSLFTIYLSGTHATIDQRLGLIEQLLRSGESKQVSLGLAALGQTLEASHFSSAHGFEFGARSRDYGYEPGSDEDVTRWYSAALALIEQLAFHGGLLKSELRNLLAGRFRGLWISAHMFDQLEDLARGFAADKFWPEGWVACRQTMRFDKDRLTKEGSARLAKLEAELGPSNLPERVRALVLSNRSDGLDLEDEDHEGNFSGAFERLQTIARELGESVAADDAVFEDLVPDLLRGGSRAWAFGRGLAAASRDPRATWARLVKGLEQLSQEERDVQMLRGFLAELWDKHREIAQTLLDTVLDQPALTVFLPALQSAVQIDQRGVERLKWGLRSGEVPVWMYRNLAWGRTTDDLAGSDLKDLLLLIADQPDGFDGALEILHMRLHSDRSARRSHEPEVLEAGRELLRRMRFKKDSQSSDYNLAHIARACLKDHGAGPHAAEIARKLRQAIAGYETYAYSNNDLLKALLGTQPTAVLDALFEGDERDQRSGIKVFDHLHDDRSNPSDEISCEDLIAWCDRAPESRYALAASIVSIADRDKQSGTRVWSKQAKKLFANAPDPKSVLAVFIDRFRPRSWSGSRAALMEANAQLLDSLASDTPAELRSFVTESKEHLERDIAAERQWETEQDRTRDERFE